MTIIFIPIRPSRRNEDEDESEETEEKIKLEDVFVKKIRPALDKIIIIL